MTTSIARHARLRRGPVVALAGVLLACGGGETGRTAAEPPPPPPPAPPPAPTFSLTVANAGTGSGRVTSTPAGIDCALADGLAASAGCSASFPTGTVVRLVASSGSTAQEFAGWAGPCTGVTECSLTVTENATLSASFRPRVRTLALTLATPNDDDGAVLLTLSGPAILALRPVAGLELSEARDTVAATGTVRSRVLLRGTLSAGVVVEVDVPGAASASQYASTVEQVAARASGGYAQRADPASYRLTLR